MDRILADRAKKVIEQVLYASVATVTSEGKPWNSPVYVVHDENYNFYWVSWRQNLHSQNVRRTGRAFLVIYDSTLPAGTGFGVYLDCEVKELVRAGEVATALRYLYGRLGEKPNQGDGFLDGFPRRIYKAKPLRVWVNVDGQVNGDFVDRRQEIKLTG